MFFVPFPSYFYLNHACYPFQNQFPLPGINSIAAEPNSDSSNSHKVTPQSSTNQVRTIIIQEAPPVTQKQTRVRAKGKTENEDEDFKPDGSSNKKKSTMKQIENRNIIPNVIRLIISFIQKKGKSERIVEKLLQKWDSSLVGSLKRFYMYQNMIKNQLNSYVNEETIRLLVQSHDDLLDIYSLAEQRLYNRITRALISHFVREDIYNFVMTSKRMQQHKKNLHLLALRSIRDKLRSLMAPK